MTMDGSDVVERVKESSNTRCEANTRLETKQSLASAPSPP
ncbi:hypothetical protein SAMN05444159_2593 [Bradyrhizobium lablabi]|uniref:Uncharacterized protein n=1 Tax=Bradyrhizobium lablabi TaxID=722472 RepID=A0A1M6Q8X0_9BRAD|nr:hypothetical protein SAMN05444159_2593 [Bradyrhizobium lablabi]